MAPPLNWLRTVVNTVRDWAHGPRGKKAQEPEVRRPRVGLALGGGFARGIAHIGVLRTLTQNNIPVDCIAGTSVGALIAAAYATGVPLEVMERRARSTQFKDFGRWRLSRMGFASNERLENYLYKVTTFHRFEETRIPLAIAATDLGSGQAVYFTRGEIGPALRASCAYPGMFLPVEHDGKILVDGFLAAPVPVDAVRMLGAEYVIAVFLDSAPEDEQPSNMIEVIGRSFSILQRHAHRNWRDKADLVIAPDVGHYAWDEFAQTPKLIAAGEAAAREALPRIRAALAPVLRAPSQAALPQT
jgi:NTE family protein